MRALISMCLVSALTTTVGSVIYAQGSTQFSPEAQKRARDLLSSPQGKYLSGTGRAALQFIAGELSVPSSGGIQLFSPGFTQSPRPAAALLGEVMVNNPDQDLGIASDISSQSETAVAGFGRTVVVAFNDSGPLGNPFAPFSGMGYSRSVDGGNTFTDVGSFPVPSGGANFGDPGLVVDRRGNFYASAILVVPGPTGFLETIGIYKSTDAGLTWPTLAAVPPGTSSPSSADKPFIAVDTSTTASSGNVYVSWTSFGPPGPVAALPIVFSRSTDGGRSFSAPITLSAPDEVAQGSEPAVGPNGEVYVTWIRLDPGPQVIMFGRSIDGGQTFSSPVAIAPVTSIGSGAGSLTGNFRVNSFPRMDVSQTNGVIYITYTSNPAGADGADVYLIASGDGGATWTPPLRVNDDLTQNDQFFPDVAVNGQGAVEVIWYDRRNDPNNLLIDVYRARVGAYGRSVSPNERVTSVSFPPAVGYDPTSNSQYMGDYLDIKALLNADGTRGAFGAAWGDNRRRITTAGGTRNDQDVFYKTIPVP